MTNVKVAKIGGATLNFDSGYDNFRKIIESFEESKVIIVVSAFGKTTSMLKEAAEAAAYSNKEKYKIQLEELKDKYFSMLEGEDALKEEATVLIEKRFRELGNILMGVSTIRELSDRILDKIMAYGELLAGELLAIMLEFMGKNFNYIPAPKLMITDRNFGQAKPIYEAISVNFKTIVNPKLFYSDIILTQGYIAGTENGDLTTMGYESSNYTASILTSEADADELEIWTDTPGIRTADPKLFKNTHLIEYISYNQALDLAKLGFKLIHRAMIEMAADKGIIVKYRTINNLEEQTVIAVENSTMMHDPIAFIRNTSETAVLIIYNVDVVQYMKYILPINHLLSNMKVDFKGNSVIHISFDKKHIDTLIDNLAEFLEEQYAEI